MQTVFDRFIDEFFYDLAIDMGSTNTLIYRKGKGIVVNEPSIVAVQSGVRESARVLRAGAGAQELFERKPLDISLVKPVRYGIVSNFWVAHAMLDNFLSRIKRKWLPTSMRVIVNVPAGATEEEKSSARNVILSSGAREVYLLDEPRALALGSGLDISEEKGNMVLDIGGGITEMAVIVEGKVTHTRSLRIGGEHMDEAIVEYLREKYDFIVDTTTAEKMKIHVGEAYPGTDKKHIMASGLDSAANRPGFIEVTSHDIAAALSKPLRMILDTVHTFLQNLPAELYVDILDRGIMLAGGGTLLRGIDKLLESEIAMPIFKARDPLACLVLGTGATLEYLKEYRRT